MKLRSPLRKVGAAGGGSGGSFSPSQLVITNGFWIDPSDLSTGFQDSAGTTPQTATAQPTGLRTDKSGRGNNLLQATAAARPIYQSALGVMFDRADGVDDGLATAAVAAGTFTNNMDFFIALRRTSAAKGLLAAQSTVSAENFCLFDPAGAALIAHSSVGANITYFVDGVQVGGTNTTTRVQLDAALTTNVWHVLEARNVDLSTWTKFLTGNYSGWPTSVDIAGAILLPAQNATVRGQLRSWLGGKVGLGL